jgi:hypothetical protein
LRSRFCPFLFNRFSRSNAPCLALRAASRFLPRPVVDGADLAGVLLIYSVIRPS